jgi:hypothetical protein
MCSASTAASSPRPRHRSASCAGLADFDPAFGSPVIAVTWRHADHLHGFDPNSAVEIHEKCAAGAKDERRHPPTSRALNTMSSCNMTIAEAGLGQGAHLILAMKHLLGLSGEFKLLIFA